MQPNCWLFSFWYIVQGPQYLKYEIKQTQKMDLNQI